MSSAANISVAQFHLKDFRYQKFCREVRKFIGEFLKEIGIDAEIGEEFSEIMASLLEWDDAYPTILKDLASETSKEALMKNPAKELDRLLKLFKERDLRPKMHETIGTPIKILKLAFLYPGIKKAFLKALETIDFVNLQMDDGDRYWSLRWLTYNAMGLSIDERMKKFMDIHEGKHPRMAMLIHNADKLKEDQLNENK